MSVKLGLNRILFLENVIWVRLIFFNLVIIFKEIYIELDLNISNKNIGQFEFEIMSKNRRIYIFSIL